MAAEIELFPCLSDNYGVLLHDPATGATASVDAPETCPVGEGAGCATDVSTVAQLTVGVSGERRVATRVRCTPG